MPNKPGAACRKTPGCTGIVRNGRCSRCGSARPSQKAYDQQRGTAAERGYDRRWRAIRQMYLRNHPLCVACLAADRTTAATDVDHIIPRRQGGTDDPANLQSLCHSCHSKKTMSSIT